MWTLQKSTAKNMGGKTGMKHFRHAIIAAVADVTLLD